MTRSRQTADWGSRAGLAKIVSSSVAVGSGTGSADSLGNVTFSGASSVSLNGCFNSKYTNYKVNISNTDYSSSGLYFRYRTSGTDNSSSGYSWTTRFNYSYNSGYFASTGNPGTYVELGTQEIDAKGFAASCEIFEPFSSNRTMMNFSANTIYRGGSGSCMYTNTTSFDGFTIYPSTGTITGTITVYGYTN